MMIRARLGPAAAQGAPARCRAAGATRASRPPGRRLPSGAPTPLPVLDPEPGPPLPRPPPRAGHSPAAHGVPAGLPQVHGPGAHPPLSQATCVPRSPAPLNKRYADWMLGAGRANQSGACWRVCSARLGLPGLGAVDGRLRFPRVVVVL